MSVRDVVVVMLFLVGRGGGAEGGGGGWGGEGGCGAGHCWGGGLRGRSK